MRKIVALIIVLAIVSVAYGGTFIGEQKITGGSLLISSGNLFIGGGEKNLAMPGSRVIAIDNAACFPLMKARKSAILFSMQCAGEPCLYSSNGNGAVNLIAGVVKDAPPWMYDNADVGLDDEFSKEINLSSGMIRWVNKTRMAYLTQSFAFNSPDCPAHKKVCVHRETFDQYNKRRTLSDSSSEYMMTIDYIVRSYEDKKK